MNRIVRQRAHRQGVTLLEVMTAVTLAATMMTSSFVVLRSSYSSWLAHEADMDRASNASAIIQHFVRHFRQSESVSAIAASGPLTVLREDGSQLTWSLSGTDVSLQVDSGTAHPVASDIQTLTFEGYEADASTVTTKAEDVHAVKVSLTVNQPAGGTRTVSSFTWLRSW